MPYGTWLWPWSGTAMWSTGQPLPVLSGARAVLWAQCGQGMKQHKVWFKYRWEVTGTKRTVIQEHYMHNFFQRHQLIDMSQILTEADIKTLKMYQWTSVSWTQKIWLYIKEGLAQLQICVSHIIVKLQDKWPNDLIMGDLLSWAQI